MSQAARFSMHREDLVRTIRQRYGAVYVIVSPPRCASTVLARVLWEHPEVRHYCHEPFDVVYHRGRHLEDALELLLQPLDLSPVKWRLAPGARALVVKEMTFQVGEHFPVLAALTDYPFLFLLRDPRLAVASRMEQRRLGGQDAVFPAAESGWDWLAEQVVWARQEGVAYAIIDAADLRAQPHAVVRTVCALLGLSYSADLLSWSAVPDLALGQLAGEQRHWYDRVLRSTGVEPEDQEPPPEDTFPAPFREHLRRWCRLYEDLRAEPGCIIPGGPDPV